RYSCLCTFFFSSRRRHTRSTRDWSSDVCSSDLFLAVALDVDHRPNIYRLRALPELVDLDRDRVGQLLMQQLERGLAHELRGEEAHWLRRHFVGVVVKRPVGEVGAQRVEQRIQTLASNGRYGGQAGGRSGGEGHQVRLGVDRADRGPG